jgi:putative tryptophan/tyrosine transport system substrate-binding protein
MKRRDLLCHLPAWLAAAPALAQAPAGQKLLVMLSPFPLTPNAETVMRQELARLGWREGDNLRLELRHADNRPERLDTLARELVALKPAAALAFTSTAARALMRQSTNVPMVVAFTFDPVAEGLAASLRRPGGQVTGLSIQHQDIRPKTYELARQVAPAARRLAGMVDRRLIPEAQFEAVFAVLRRMAQQVNMEYVPLLVRDAGEIEAALRSLTPARDFVLGLNSDELMYANFATTAALARTLRLPSFSQHQMYARVFGGLFSYGPDMDAMWQRAVQMAAEVLRGQPVGEMPFEQPSRISLTINRTTADAIGVVLPRDLLLRADEVIG